MTRAMAVVVCLGACSVGAPCDPDAGGTDAPLGATDGESVDARGDASRTRCAGTPATLAVGAVVQMTSPAEGHLYEGTEPGHMRLEIYRHGELTPVVTRVVTGYADLSIGPVTPGDYDLALSFDGYTAGATLMDDDRCEARSGPECPPVTIEVRDCETVNLTVALFCDPAARTCPAQEW